MVHQSLRRAFAGLILLLLATSSALAQGTRPTGGAPTGAGGPPTGVAPAGPAATGAAPSAYPATRPAGGHHPVGAIALIDVGYILKHHAGFKQRQEEFQHQWEARENDIKAKQDALRKLAMQLNDYAKGSAQYKQLEEEVTKRQGELQVEINLTKRKYQEAESKLFYDAYKQVHNEVRLHCEQNNIVMVMKFNGEPVNDNNPSEVEAELFGKPMLYHNPGIDITPAILERMKGQQVRGPGPSPATNNAMRPGLPPQQPPRQ